MSRHDNRWMNHALVAWLKVDYHQQMHRETGQSPHERYQTVPGGRSLHTACRSERGVEFLSWHGTTLGRRGSFGRARQQPALRCRSTAARRDADSAVRSLFNELADGPRHGHEHLGGIPHDSNIDSGQDLLYLKRWIAQHPDARPLHIAFNGLYGPELAGIDFQPAAPQPQPVWHGISVNRLRSRGGTFAEYLRLQPVDIIGYSIYVYRVE